MKPVLMLASFFLFFSAQASSEKMDNVELYNCTESFCVKLKASRLYKSALGKNYAFGPSDIEIIFDGKLERKTFAGFEGSFDARSGRFYLSKKKAAKEYLIDTKEKSVSSFQAPSF